MVPLKLMLSAIKAVTPPGYLLRFSPITKLKNVSDIELAPKRHSFHADEPTMCSVDTRMMGIRPFPLRCHGPWDGHHLARGV